MHPSQHGAPNNSPLKIIALMIGGVMALCMLICMGGFFWLMTGPEGGARLANEMEPYALEYIEEHALVEPDESIVAYYDVTIRLRGTEAYILTDKRVIHHRESGNHSVNLADIEEIMINKDEIGSTIIEIFSDDGGHMKLEIPILNNGEAFGRSLTRYHERARGL